MSTRSPAFEYLIWAALLLGIGFVLARNRKQFLLTKLRGWIVLMIFFAACMQLAVLALMSYVLDLRQPRNWLFLALALLPTFAVLYVWRIAARAAHDDTEH